MYMFLKVCLFLSLLWLDLSDVAADNSLSTCAFDAQLGSAVCLEEVEDDSFPFIDDSLQLAIDRYINDFESTLPRVEKTQQKLRSLYNDVRENFEDSALELEELLARLRTDLSSFDEYLDNQERVIRAVLIAFHAFGENSTFYGEFATEVFFCAAQFLKSSLESVSTVGNSQFSDYPLEIAHYYTMSRQYSFTAQAQPHTYFIFLVRCLGKKLKLEFLGEAALSQASSELSGYSAEEIRRASQYLGLMWLHGTKAYSVKSAHSYTDGYFLPSGVLYKKSIEMLSGKLDVGATPLGVNRKSLSGCPLGSYREVIWYANLEKFSIEEEKQKFENLLQLNLGKEWYNYSDGNGEFSRLVKAVSRIKAADYAYYEANKDRLINKVFEFYQSIEVNIFGDNPDTELNKLFFHWHDRYYSAKFYLFLHALQRLRRVIDEPQREVSNSEMVLGKIPAVIGSFNRMGIPRKEHTIDDFMSEHLFEGGLKLGEEIQVIFVYEEDLALVENLIQEIGMEGRVKVESMTVLEVAGRFDQKLSGTLSDPYSFPTNRRVGWFDQAFQFFSEYLPDFE